MARLLLLSALVVGSAVTAAAENSVTTAPESQLPQSSRGLKPTSVETPAVLTPTLRATGEFWSNEKGGAKKGARWNTLIDLGLALDLERLGAIKGSQLVVQFFGVQNQDDESTLSDLTGALNPVSGLHAGNQLRVFNLHYRQTWNDDMYVLKIGQLAIDDDFMGSDFAGLFANSAFGAMPSQVATPLAASADNTPAFPIYAVASPGVYFSAKASESSSWQLGIYHGGPGPDEKNNHGFKWKSGAATGAVGFLETAWRSKLVGRDSTLRMGTTYHTGKFDDFDALNAGEPDASARGLYSFYVGHDFVLSVDASGKPSFATFWRAGLSPQRDRSVVGKYGDVGFNWFGPLACRPDDSAGVAFSWTEFGRDYRTHVGTNVLAASETTVEFTYRAQLSSHWAVQADLQFLDRPADSTATGNHRNATVVGFRTELTF